MERIRIEEREGWLKVKLESATQRKAPQAVSTNLAVRIFFDI